MKKILIIEDDTSIAEIQKDYLEMSGYSVTVAPDGIVGLEEIRHGQYDLVVLDLMLPGMDGVEIMKKIGESKKFPVLVLSAKSEETDKIKVLGLGADDYMTKPFGMGEFVARVKSHLKIYEKFSTASKPDSTLTARTLTIDRDAHRVFLEKKEIILTQKEYELLLYMAENPNRVFTKDQLFERIWGFDAISDTTTVTVHISKLREKIEAIPSKPQYIETVWGIGYRFKV